MMRYLFLLLQIVVICSVSEVNARDFWSSGSDSQYYSDDGYYADDEDDYYGSGRRSSSHSLRRSSSRYSLDDGYYADDEDDYYDFNNSFLRDREDRFYPDSRTNDRHSRDFYLRLFDKFREDYQITGFNIYRFLVKNSPIRNRNKKKIDIYFGINNKLLNTLNLIINQKEYPSLYLAEEDPMLSEEIWQNLENSGNQGQSKHRKKNPGAKNDSKTSDSAAGSTPDNASNESNAGTGLNNNGMTNSPSEDGENQEENDEENTDENEEEAESENNDGDTQVAAGQNPPSAQVPSAANAMNDTMVDQPQTALIVGNPLMIYDPNNPNGNDGTEVVQFESDGANRYPINNNQSSGWDGNLLVGALAGGALTGGVMAGINGWGSDDNQYPLNSIGNQQRIENITMDSDITQPQMEYIPGEQAAEIPSVNQDSEDNSETDPENDESNSDSSAIQDDSAEEIPENQSDNDQVDVQNSDGEADQTPAADENSEESDVDFYENADTSSDENTSESADNTPEDAFDANSDRNPTESADNDSEGDFDGDEVLDQEVETDFLPNIDQAAQDAQQDVSVRQTASTPQLSYEQDSEQDDETDVENTAVSAEDVSEISTSRNEMRNSVTKTRQTKPKVDNVQEFLDSFHGETVVQRAFEPHYLNDNDPVFVPQNSTVSNMTKIPVVQVRKTYDQSPILMVPDLSDGKIHANHF